MVNTRSFLEKICSSVSVILTLILLAACAPPNSKMNATEVVSLSPTIQDIHHNSITPSLLAEWTMGEVKDMAWSPDSRMFAVNYYLQGNNIQAFDVKSLNRMWTSENSLAMDLVFTPDGKLIAESNSFVGVLYLRSVGQGDVVRQIKSENCVRSGQAIIANPRENTLLIADTNELSGLNATNIVIISQWNLGTGQCNNLIQYTGGFNVFDLNSGNTLLAYGGEGKDDSVVIWDMEKQAEICRIKKIDFGRFVPGQNTLAVTRDQKIVFIDASSCQELRELNLTPTSVNYFSFSPDGRWFAIASESIQIMETSTGKTIAQVPLPENSVLSSSMLFDGIVFSPDGRFLLLAFSTATNGIISSKVQLWQVQQ